MRAGEPAAAERAAEDLEAADDGARGTLPADLALSVRAHAAAAAGRTAEALSLLESMRSGSRFDQTMWSPFHSQARERYLRAELLTTLSREEEAVTWYSSFAEVSVYDLPYLAPSLVRLAAIRERLGQPQRAAAAREQARHLWDGCDARLRPALGDPGA